MDNLTLEVVLFELKEGVDEAEFLTAAKQIEPWLKEVGGFIKRDLYKGDGDEWVDIIHWASREEALQAAEKIMSLPEGQAFGSKIKESSIKMLHIRRKHTLS